MSLPPKTRANAIAHGYTPTGPGIDPEKVFAPGHPGSAAVTPAVMERRRDEVEPGYVTDAETLGAIRRGLGDPPDNAELLVRFRAMLTRAAVGGPTTGGGDCPHGDAVRWNPYNGVVQCHRCGQRFTPAPAPSATTAAVDPASTTPPPLGFTRNIITQADGGARPTPPPAPPPEAWRNIITQADGGARRPKGEDSLYRTVGQLPPGPHRRLSADDFAPFPPPDPPHHKRRMITRSGGGGGAPDGDDVDRLARAFHWLWRTLFAPPAPAIPPPPPTPDRPDEAPTA